MKFIKLLYKNIVTVRKIQNNVFSSRIYGKLKIREMLHKEFLI